MSKVSYPSAPEPYLWAGAVYAASRNPRFAGSTTDEGDRLLDAGLDALIMSDTSILCFKCTRVSHSKGDVVNGFCVGCDKFHAAHLTYPVNMKLWKAANEG